jgi:membrane protein DedA with SNARE-associated domain
VELPVLAAYFDSIMMFAVGAYATGVAFGRLPPPTKDVATGQQWLARHGNWLRIVGPMLMLIAAILAYSHATGLDR